MLINKQGYWKSKSNPKDGGDANDEVADEVDVAFKLMWETILFLTVCLGSMLLKTRTYSDITSSIFRHH